MTTHEVLVAARNTLERDGWMQGWGCPGGPRCVNGAIQAGAGPSCCHFTDAVLEIAAAAGVECNVMAPIGWNNAPGRTKEEVLAAFDKAIAETAPPPADPFPVERYETTKAVVV